MTVSESPQQQSYAPLTAVIVTAVVFLGAQVVGATVFGLLLLLVPGYGSLDGAAVERKLLGEPWLYLALIALIDLIAVLAIKIAMKRTAMNWRDIGFGAFRLEHVGYALVGYAMSFVGSVIVLTALAVIFTGVNFDQEQNLGIATNISGLQLIPMFVALVVLPPLVEELMMRGFLYTNLRRRLSFEWSAVVVSVLFGLAHITQADDGLFVSGAASFFVLSLVLCWLREKTGSIWPSVGVQALQNGIAFMALYVWNIA